MNADSLLETVGYAGVFISVFIECGVPLGLILPLPGYSLLFAAGVFAEAGHMSLPIVIGVGLSASILGYIAGYYTGYKYGRKLFYEIKTKKYFTEKQGRKTEKFMKRYGYTTLIVGRFIAFVHNLAPILGGVAKTPFAKFMLANIIGAILWVLSAVFLGFFVGQNLPNADSYVIPFIIVLMVTLNTPWGRKILRKFTNMIENY